MDSKTFYFWRQGAMIPVPPMMLKDIAEFCIGAYAQKLLKTYYELGGSGLSQIEEANLLRKMIPLKRKEIINLGRSVHYFAPTNLSGWKDPFNIKPQWIDYLPQKIKGVNCQFYFIDRGDKAEWNGQDFTLKIFVGIPLNLDDLIERIKNFNDFEHDITDSVEHELLHMVQTIGGVLKGLYRKSKSFAGLPPKKVINKEYDIFGGSKRTQDEQSEYILRDIEFYPLLLDALNEFKRRIINVPIKYRKIVLKKYIGLDVNVPTEINKLAVVNSFFDDLKRQNHAKWKVAVKRFINFVQEKGILIE